MQINIINICIHWAGGYSSVRRVQASPMLQQPQQQAGQHCEDPALLRGHPALAAAAVPPPAGRGEDGSHQVDTSQVPEAVPARRPRAPRAAAPLVQIQSKVCHEKHSAEIQNWEAQ